MSAVLVYCKWTLNQDDDEDDDEDMAEAHIQPLSEPQAATQHTTTCHKLTHTTGDGAQKPPSPVITSFTITPQIFDQSTSSQPTMDLNRIW